MNKTIEEEILKELRRISKLLSLAVTKDQDQQKDRVDTLSHAGFKPKEIADLLDTNPNIVRAVLSQIKKKEQAETKKGKNKKAESDDSSY